MNLNHPAHFIHGGFFQMSVPNLLAIIAMFIVFALALVLPFPGHRKGGS